jgi:hypothetical protein
MAVSNLFELLLQLDASSICCWSFGQYVTVCSQPDVKGWAVRNQVFCAVEAIVPDVDCSLTLIAVSLASIEPHIFLGSVCYS